MSKAQSSVLPVDRTAVGYPRRPARQGIAFSTATIGPIAPLGRAVATCELAAPAQTRVYLYAKDSILRNGVATGLLSSPSIVLGEGSGADPLAVAVLVVDDLQPDVLAIIGGIRRGRTTRIVVVATRLTQATVTAALEAGVWYFLRRSEARADRLLATVRRASDALGPPAGLDEALGGLAGHLDPDEPVPTSWLARLSARDVEVLRLVADGQSTASIAHDLSYSESTIKSVVHVIVRQMGARNRAHAVALAIRARVI